MNDDFIIEDCIRFLTTILRNNPNADYVEIFIRQSPVALSFNKWLNAQLYGYTYPRTRIKLEDAGVFKEVQAVHHVLPSLEKITPILTEALTDGTQELSKTDLYEGRVYKPGNIIPGMVERKVEGLRGLYKVKMAINTIKNWLKSVGIEESFINDSVAWKPTKMEMKKQLASLKKVKKLGKKQSQFLSALSDMEKHSTKELRKTVDTKDLKHIKASLQKKIEKSPWKIQSSHGNDIALSFYWLEYLPTATAK